MKVIICGAGQVGFGIAERLASESNDVTVIDSAPHLIQTIADTLDVRGFVGHGSHPDVLSRAGAEEADMIIAVTLHDEVNMVACQVAHSLFNIPTKIARVRAQSYLHSHWRDLFSREHMPIDVIISPEIEVGEMVLRRLSLPGAFDVVSFADGNISVVGVRCEEDCAVVDTPLVQLTELFPDLAATVVGIVRGGKLFVPHSQDHMLVGDEVFLIAAKDQVERSLAIFGHEEQQANRVVIVGGGNIGLFVARELEERNTRSKAKIVEHSRDRAISIADKLARTIVLHGNALDEDMLLESDVERAETMVALTNDDQVNILSAVMAKRLGCQRVLTLINNRGYSSILHSLGIDAFVNPRAVTVSKILQHVRRGRIRGVHSIRDGEGEVLEAEALETSPLIGQPLRDLDLPDGVRIGGIYRKGQVVIPRGDTLIQANDRIVIFALTGKVKEVEHMFRVSLAYFWYRNPGVVVTGVLSLLGLFLAVLAAAMLFPVLIATAIADYATALAFLVSMAVTAFVSGGLTFALLGIKKTMRRVEVLMLAALIWIVIPLFGAMPMLMSGAFTSMDLAYFEAVSGFTTNGATVIDNLDTMSAAIIAWRAILQWLGGFATLVIILVIIAPAGIGGTPERPLTMIESGARQVEDRVRTMVWRIGPLYAGLTFICFGLLSSWGVPLLDSFCLALSTISTGGFMPHDGGLNIYNSNVVEVIIGFFMFAGATSVVWHRMIVKMRWVAVHQYREGPILFLVAVVVGDFFAYGFYYGIDGPSGIGWGNAALQGLLTALSVISTTGFEFREGGFAAISLSILITVALIGGAGYSTAGGIKLYRIGAMLVQAGRELRRLIYPHGVRPTHFGGQVYDIQIMKSIWCATLMFLITVSGVTVALGFSGLDFQAALVMAVSSIANIGPLYDALAPLHEGWLSIAALNSASRLLLEAAMIAGRLEILAILALFNISYWRS